MKQNIAFKSLLLSATLLLSLPTPTLALEGESNSITTRVGNPVVEASSCPIPQGTVTCGSKYTPINGCGHCGVGYPSFGFQYCTYEGINWAMDVGGRDYQDIILPLVKGNVVEWTFRDAITGSTQEIQRFTGVDKKTGEQYFIQFHHTQTGSGNRGTHLSGERAANICGGGCNQFHTHVEFGSGSAFGTSYLDSPLYFCGQ